jgi:hypothetical protein
LVPHSRREMVLAAAMRTSRVAARSGWPTLGMKRVEPLAERNPAKEANIRKFCTLLHEAGVIPEGDPSFITLDDYGETNRGKEVIFIFGPHDERPRVVMKASSNPAHVATLAREHATLSSVRAQVGDALRHTIPTPMATLSQEGWTAFAEQYLPGHSMYLETRNSFAPHGLVDRHFKLARDWLVAFQNATCEGEARFGDRDLELSVIGPLTEYERLYQPASSERAFIAKIVSKAREFESEQMSVVASQGDFWARNLILDRGGLSVLDWEGYRERGSPFFDLLLFSTSYALSYPWKLGRWSEPATAFRAAFSARSWMAKLIRGQLFNYCEISGISPKLLDVCFPAFLAQRAVEEDSHRVSCSDSGDVKDAHGGSAMRQGVSTKGQMWRKLFQEYARMDGYAFFG